MRAFIGVPVDHHLALALVEQRDRAAQQLGAGVMQPVAARNLHMTLAFLGEIDDGQLQRLRQGLPQWLAKQSAWRQGLQRCALFPDRRGRCAAAEGAPESSMSRLTAALDQGLKSIGWTADSRPIRPHITLAHLHAPLLQPLEWSLSLHLEVTEVVLFESRVGRQGNDYRRLASVSLPPSRQ